jgi:hypothetical protein
MSHVIACCFVIAMVVAASDVPPTMSPTTSTDAPVAPETDAPTATPVTPVPAAAPTGVPTTSAPVTAVPTGDAPLFANDTLTWWSVRAGSVLGATRLPYRPSFVSDVDVLLVARDLETVTLAVHVDAVDLQRACGAFPASLLRGPFAAFGVSYTPVGDTVSWLATVRTAGLRYTHASRQLWACRNGTWVSASASCPVLARFVQAESSALDDGRVRTTSLVCGPGLYALAEERVNDTTAVCNPGLGGCECTDAQWYNGSSAFSAGMMIGFPLIVLALFARLGVAVMRRCHGDTLPVGLTVARDVCYLGAVLTIVYTGAYERPPDPHRWFADDAVSHAVYFAALTIGVPLSFALSAWGGACARAKRTAESANVEVAALTASDETELAEPTMDSAGIAHRAGPVSSGRATTRGPPEWTDPFLSRDAAWTGTLAVHTLVSVLLVSPSATDDIFIGLLVAMCVCEVSWLALGTTSASCAGIGGAALGVVCTFVSLAYVGRVVFELAGVPCGNKPYLG